jgi:hypothetical protein
LQLLSAVDSFMGANELRSSTHDKNNANYSMLIPLHTINSFAHCFENGKEENPNSIW